MDMHAEILKGATEIKVGSEQVKVRELTWMESLELLKKLSDHLGKLFTVSGDGVATTALSPAKIVEAVTSTEDLALYLVEKSTGRQADWFRALSVSDALTVLDAAAALNLSEHILGKVRALGRHFADVMPGAKVTASARSTVF